MASNASTISRRLRAANWVISPSARKHRHPGVFVTGAGSHANVLVDTGVDVRNEWVADGIVAELKTWSQVSDLSVTDLGSAKAIHLTYTPDQKTERASTPTVVVARTLRQLGLKQGRDFRVQGQYQGKGADRERIGTHVAILSAHGDQVVADNADRIERATAAQGFGFNVSILFTAGGRMWTWIANYGHRTRDAAPTSAHRPTTGPARPAADTRHAVKNIEQRPGRTAAPVITATLGEPRPAFEQTSQADLDAARKAWPEGLRVKGWDSSGKPRTGRVTTMLTEYKGAHVGQVTQPEHPNHGRVYVDVTWDELPGDMGTGRRNRPFADELTRI